MEGVIFFLYKPYSVKYVNSSINSDLGIKNLKSLLDTLDIKGINADRKDLNLFCLNVDYCYDSLKGILINENKILLLI